MDHCSEHQRWQFACPGCYLARVPNPYPALRATQLRGAIDEAEDCAIRSIREARECERIAQLMAERGDELRSAACVRAAAHHEASAAGWIRDAERLRNELDRLPRA